MRKWRGCVVVGWSGRGEAAIVFTQIFQAWPSSMINSRGSIALVTAWTSATLPRVALTRDSKFKSTRGKRLRIPAVWQGRRNSTV